MRVSVKLILGGLLLALTGHAARAQGADCAAGHTWAQTPSPNDLSALYPEAAIVGGVEGEATLHCRRLPDGALGDCSVAAESPAGFGFGKAALAVAPALRMSPDCKPKTVTLPIHFSMPVKLRTQAPRRAAVFQTPTGAYASLAPAGPYWPERALRLGAGGLVVMECKVAADLRLQACRLVGEEPEEVDFGRATLKMAQRGWMTAAPLPLGAATPADGFWSFVVLYPRRARVLH